MSLHIKVSNRGSTWAASSASAFTSTCIRLFKKAFDRRDLKGESWINFTWIKEKNSYSGMPMLTLIV